MSPVTSLAHLKHAAIGHGQRTPDIAHLHCAAALAVDDLDSFHVVHAFIRY
jgi:hypothetical protein